MQASKIYSITQKYVTILFSFFGDKENLCKRLKCHLSGFHWNFFSQNVPYIFFNQLVFTRFLEIFQAKIARKNGKNSKSHAILRLQLSIW